MRTIAGLPVGNILTSEEIDIPTAGTAVQLVSTSTPCIGVIVSNVNAANAIYVGNSSVDKTDARGIRLNTGDWVYIPVGDASLIYVDGTSNGDDAGYLIIS